MSAGCCLGFGTIALRRNFYDDHARLGPFSPRFRQFASIAVPNGTQASADFLILGLSFPFKNRVFCPISEVVRVVCLGRLPILSGPQPSNHREAGIYHQPRPRKVRLGLGYIDRFIK